jgi:hypothetical protein
MFLWQRLEIESTCLFLTAYDVGVNLNSQNKLWRCRSADIQIYPYFTTGLDRPKALEGCHIRIVLWWQPFLIFNQHKKKKKILQKTIQSLFIHSLGFWFLRKNIVFSFPYNPIFKKNCLAVVVILDLRYTFFRRLYKEHSNLSQKLLQRRFFLI